MLRQERKEALRLVATMLGRRFGVQVVFNNISTAATDGKVIYLPNLATAGTDEDIALLYGLVAHEAAHCRFTKFGTNAQENVLVRALENIFEDIRIELALVMIFPGASRMLFDAAQGLVDRGIFSSPVDGQEYEPADVLCRALVSGLRHKHLDQQCFVEVAKEWLQHAEECFGEDLIADVFNLSAKSASLASTDEAQALAWEVYELLETSAEEKEKDAQRKKQQQSSEEDDSTDSPTAQGGSDTDESRQSQGDGSDAESDTDESQQSQGDGSDVESDTDESDAESQASATRQALQTSSVAPVGLEDMLRQEMGASNVMGSRARSSHAARNRGRRDAYNVSNYANRYSLKAKLGVRLASLIESTVEENAWDGYSGRRLSRGAPEKLARGDLKIFRKKEEVEGVNTAVALLVDYSGSMWTNLPLLSHASASSSHGCVSAQDAAYETHFALAAVLATYEVPFLSIAFAEHVCVLKEFDETMAAHRWDDGASGDTCTGDALEEALVRMTMRDEEKRIVVVVTDGDPNDLESLMVGCHFAKKNGIDVAFVFIGSSGGELESMLQAEGGAFDRASSADQLSRAVFGAVAKAVA